MLNAQLRLKTVVMLRRVTRTGGGGKEEVKREPLVQARVTRGPGEGVMDGGWCHVGFTRHTVL